MRRKHRKAMRIFRASFRKSGRVYYLSMRLANMQNKTQCPKLHLNTQMTNLTNIFELFALLIIFKLSN